MKSCTICALLLVAVALLAQEASTRPKSSNQITGTRTVHVFTELEHQLATALHSHDQEAIENLLAPDFEVRRSASPGMPVPRADFVNEQHSAETKISQMAVRLVGSTAIASFIATASKSSFIVDTWAQDGPSWKLVARYQSPATTSADRPGPDKRPTGRE